MPGAASEAGAAEAGAAEAVAAVAVPDESKRRRRSKTKEQAGAAEAGAAEAVAAEAGRQLSTPEEQPAVNAPHDQQPGGGPAPNQLPVDQALLHSTVQLVVAEQEKSDLTATSIRVSAVREEVGKRLGFIPEQMMPIKGTLRDYFHQAVAEWHCFQMSWEERTRVENKKRTEKKTKKQLSPPPPGRSRHVQTTKKTTSSMGSSISRSRSSMSSSISRSNRSSSSNSSINTTGLYIGF